MAAPPTVLVPGHSTLAPLRSVTATRYVTALREGGSMPGLVEADDDGLYVVKFRGAGQGPRVLVAELIAGELPRDHLGDEHPGSLPRALELEDVQAVVVGLDERRQRAALTQRGDIAGCRDRAHRARG